MKSVCNANLDNRLNTHFATLTASSSGVAAQRNRGNWQVYAAVTGSALAMASSASAAVIFGQGPAKSGSPNLVTSSGLGRATSAQNIQLKTAGGGNAGIGFSFGVLRSVNNAKSQSGGTGNGSVFLRNQSSKMGFLWTNTHQKVDKLASGVKISSHSPFANPVWEGTAPKLATSCVGHGCLSSPSHNGWAPNQYGFAAFEFQAAPFAPEEFGWIQLEYTLGRNGLANGLTVKDWAYDNTGAPIAAGQGGSTTPEPATFGLGLLAAGAVGISALRRRKKSAV